MVVGQFIMKGNCLDLGKLVSWKTDVKKTDRPRNDLGPMTRRAGQHPGSQIQLKPSYFLSILTSVVMAQCLTMLYIRS